MHIIVKDGDYRTNLFSDLAYFMGSECELFGRTDFSLRLVQHDGGLWVKHSSHAMDLLGQDPAFSHKLDLPLIEIALETRDVVIIGAYKEGTTLFTNSILSNIKYLACSSTDKNKVIDLLTGSFVSLDGPVSALMVIAKASNLGVYVAYLDPLFLKAGSMFTTTPDFTIGEARGDGSLRDSLIQPIISGAIQAGDVILTKDVFNIDILPNQSDTEVENFILSNCKVTTNLSYQIVGRQFRVSGKSAGFFNVECDLGFVSSLKSEQCNLNFVVRNVGGAYL